MLPASSAVGVPVSPAAPVSPADAAEVPFEVRWNAWIERGLEHDRTARRHLLILIAVVATAAVIALIYSAAGGVR